MNNSKLLKRKLRKWILIISVAVLSIFFIVALLSSVAGRLQNEIAGLMGSDDVQNMISDQEEEASGGKATYVGVDDRDTDYSASVIRETRKWSIKHNPCSYGYGGLCELWVSDVIQSAGYSYGGSCCAYNSSLRAKKTGKIPKGAAIYSGTKPDGSKYENGHRASAWCNNCGHWAGHVAIYIGNGIVVGAQYPYKLSVDGWIDIFGYGGWYKPKTS